MKENTKIIHWKKCNYCREVVPATECTGFKCNKCIQKERDKTEVKEMIHNGSDK